MAASARRRRVAPPALQKVQSLMVFIVAFVATTKTAPDAESIEPVMRMRLTGSPVTVANVQRSSRPRQRSNTESAEPASRKTVITTAAGGSGDAEGVLLGVEPMDKEGVWEGVGVAVAVHVGKEVRVTRDVSDGGADADVEGLCVTCVEKDPHAVEVKIDDAVAPLESVDRAEPRGDAEGRGEFVALCEERDEALFEALDEGEGESEGGAERRADIVYVGMGDDEEANDVDADDDVDAYELDESEAERDVERVTVLQEDCVALEERVRCIEGDPDEVMKLLVTRGVLQGDAL